MSLKDLTKPQKVMLSIAAVGAIIYGACRLEVFKSPDLECQSEVSKGLIQGIADKQGIKVVSIGNFHKVSSTPDTTECEAMYTIEAVNYFTGAKFESEEKSLRYRVYKDDTNGDINLVTHD